MVTESTPFPTSSNSSPGGLSGGTPAGSTGADGMPSSSGTATAAAASGEDLMRRVVQGAHSTIDRLADTAAPAVSRLQESVAGAGDKLHAGADHMREMGDEWAESLRTTVRENPIASVAVALAVGVLIARLASR